MTYEVSAGQISTGIILNGDSMHVYTGGIADSTTVIDWGEMYVYNGGTANSTTVIDWGQMYVSSGGTVNNTTINSGILELQGTAINTILDGGGSWGEAGMLVSKGGTAINTTIYNGGILLVAVMATRSPPHRTEMLPPEVVVRPRS